MVGKAAAHPEKEEEEEEEVDRHNPLPQAHRLVRLGRSSGAASRQEVGTN